MVMETSTSKLKKITAIIGILNSGISGVAIAGGTDSTGASDSYINQYLKATAPNTGSTLSSAITPTTTQTSPTVRTYSDFNKCPATTSVSMPVYLNLYRGYTGTYVEIQSAYKTNKKSVSTSTVAFNTNVTFYKTMYVSGEYIYYSPYSDDMSKLTSYSSNQWDVRFTYGGVTYPYAGVTYPYAGVPKAQYGSYEYTVYPASTTTRRTTFRYGAVDMTYAVKCDVNGNISKTNLKATYYTRGGNSYSNHSDYSNHDDS
jgi:hypothetical protein